MDIVIVTYNSEKWIKNCITAIEKADTGMINLYMVDNHSTDQTCNFLQQIKKSSKLNKIELCFQKENKGFGFANNLGAKLGKDSIICFINVDTEVYPDTFINLQKEIETSDMNTGVWEMRQIPYEHPKIYDPVTQGTSWTSGAAFAVRRDVFEKINGFDEQIFMYAEDVDLSWRIRTLGYQIRYCPKVKIKHYSYQETNEVKPLQYVNSLINNLLLRYRYGTKLEIIKGHLLYWKVILLHRSPFVGAKKVLMKEYFLLKDKKVHFKSTRCDKKGIAKFIGWDYEITRTGSFLCNNEEWGTEPLVSIIVRTCQRPDTLRETLISIKKQTYCNIEVIVVEDGPESAKKMIEEEFFDMNIKYYATGTKSGRSFAGNLGLEKSSGEYLNFLDDDDLFYADHVECLVSTIMESGTVAAYSYGFETPVSITSDSPYKYEIKAYNKRYQTKFDEVELCYHNYIPIQCIMFSRKLFEEYGGFDTSLDYLEDWDLWVRYAQKGAFAWVEKTTSLYKVPYEKTIQKSRQKKLDDALKTVREKHKSYHIPVNANKLAKYGKSTLRENSYVTNTISNLWK